ncbi:MAG: hypothetical protein M0Z56_05125, partial [Desulfobacteraceae bacterium]|nr:hypothetical protein [Desulfobacteraceae bacterium]
SFKDYFLGQRVVESLACDSLKNVENVSADIDKAVSEIVFNIDPIGCPPGLAFPDVPAVYSPYKWNLKLPPGYNLRLAVSQDMLNGMLERLVDKKFEWDLYELLCPVLGKNFIGFARDKNIDQKTIMQFSVPPVLDLRSSQINLEADDVVIEYRLEGEPQWQASVDMDLLCEVRVVNQALAFYISTVPGNCHFHIMKDNAGNLGLLDHSNLVNDIACQLPVMLGGFPGDPVFTIPLDSLEPFLVLNYYENPLSITAQNGYLYLDADTAAIEFSMLTKNTF